MTTLSLNTASDEAINAAVAEHCAGLTIVPPGIGHNQPLCFREPRTAANQLPTAIPDYLHSADAVIELLEKGAWRCNNYVDGRICVWVDDCNRKVQYQADKSFCRAACIALLKASGKIEVTE